jgi:hypothetical protein
MTAASANPADGQNSVTAPGEVMKRTANAVPAT